VCPYLSKSILKILMDIVKMAGSNKYIRNLLNPNLFTHTSCGGGWLGIAIQIYLI
jgi:hypothetical protein